MSLDTEYKPKKAVNRGNSDSPEVEVDPVRDQLQEELQKLEAAEDRDPRAIGITYTLLGDYKRAISHLDTAAKTDDDAKIDLAAALLLRGGTENAKLALQLSEASDDPRAVWNRAIANLYLGNYRAAKDDYDTYLRLDPASDWSDKARAEIKEIDALLKPTN